MVLCTIARMKSILFLCSTPSTTHHNHSRLSVISEIDYVSVARCLQCLLFSVFTFVVVLPSVFQVFQLLDDFCEPDFGVMKIMKTHPSTVYTHHRNLKPYCVIAKAYS